MRKIVLAMTALMLTTTASAAVTELNIEKDLSHNLIEINGKALPNESVSFQVLPDGTTLQNFAESDSKNDIPFVYECKADANGAFSFKAELKNNGEYNVHAASSEVTVAATSASVDFYLSNEYTEKIDVLNRAKTESGETGFINTAKADENIAILGFNENINDVVSVEEILSFMYKELGSESLKADEYLENIYLYRNSFAVLALNKGLLTDIDTYVKNIIDEDATLAKYWGMYVTKNEVENYLINKISKKSISSVSDLKVKIKEGLILAATKYPNGYMTLKDLYTDYKNEIGLIAISSNNAVYKEIGGKDYVDIAALKRAYNAAVTKPNDSGSSSSGGGGGGSSVGNDAGSGNMLVGIDNNVSAQPHPIALKFLDLTAYEWAYPSISTLYDKGIVSGVAENQFAPSRQVKREEFVKMIASALNLAGETGTAFGDVDNSAWYAPYVYSAYSNGIINGVSKNTFGVAKNITRQDMAVIIYNALKSKGYAKTDFEISFDDKGDVAGYAKEAVEQLVSLGIINGKGDNRFAPTEDATRAEAAVIIERALQYLK